nr:uncharacterized protein LOC123761664 [Procambarus clarkii]
MDILSEIAPRSVVVETSRSAHVCPAGLEVPSLLLLCAHTFNARAMNWPHLTLVLGLALLLGTEVVAHLGYYGHHRHQTPFGHHVGGGGRLQGGGRVPGGGIVPGGGRVPGGGIIPGGGRIPGGGTVPGGGRVPGGNIRSTTTRPTGGSCPPVRPACPATRIQPVMCSTDSECLAGRKCCFDACVQTEVCKATV